MDAQEPPEFIGALSRRLWQWVRVEIYAAVQAAGFDDLTPAQVAAFRHPGIQGLRPTELAAQLQVTKQSAHQLLGDLEARGYLNRTPDLADSRSRIITLTSRGRALDALVRRSAAQADATAAELLGPQRFRDFRDALTELVTLTGTSQVRDAPRRKPSLARPHS